MSSPLSLRPSSTASRIVARALFALALIGAGATRASATAPERPRDRSDARAIVPFHLRLEKSEPAKGDALAASPTVIRLWFSLAPEMAVTAVKLADADGKPVTLSAPRRGTGAKDPVEVDIPQKLAAGSYTVSWKTSSKDGHPVTGDFTFTVTGGAK
jgi:methionine-rich copper-binding protein CopC